MLSPTSNLLRNIKLDRAESQSGRIPTASGETPQCITPAMEHRQLQAKIYMYARCDVPFITFIGLRDTVFSSVAWNVAVAISRRRDDEDITRTMSTHRWPLLLRLAPPMTRISDLRISNDTSVTTVSSFIYFYSSPFDILWHVDFTHQMSRSFDIALLTYILLFIKLDEVERIYDNFKKFVVIFCSYKKLLNT